MKMFKKFYKEKGGIIGENGEFLIDLDDFKEFHKNFAEAHKGCGPNCIHLQRFYSKIGYYPFWNNRKPLEMKKTSVDTFGGLGGFPGPMKKPG